MIKVTIVDDHELVRTGIIRLLSDVSGIEVVAEASSGEEAVQLVEERHPDVVLMDVQMPDMDGLEATRLIKNRWPRVKVVVLTMYNSHRVDALTAGADAFLLKGCSDQELLAAILNDV